jgi:hypothetical protein
MAGRSYTDYAGTPGFGGDGGFIPSGATMTGLGYWDGNHKWHPLFDSPQGTSSGGGVGFSMNSGQAVRPELVSVPEGGVVTTGGATAAGGTGAANGGLFSNGALLSGTKGAAINTGISAGTGLLNSYLDRKTSRENQQAQIGENAKDRAQQREFFEKGMAFALQAQERQAGMYKDQLTGARENVAPYLGLGSNAASTLGRLMGFGGGGGISSAPPAIPPAAPAPVAPVAPVAPAIAPPAPSMIAAPSDGRSPTVSGDDAPPVQLQSPTGQVKLVAAKDVAHYEALGARRV